MLLKLHVDKNYAKNFRHYVILRVTSYVEVSKLYKLQMQSNGVKSHSVSEQEKIIDKKYNSVSNIFSGPISLSS